MMKNGQLNACKWLLCLRLGITQAAIFLDHSSCPSPRGETSAALERGTLLRKTIMEQR